EAMNSREKQFADGCLHAKLEQLGSLPAQDIADGMLEASRLYSGGVSPHEDDRTIVVLKYSGASR
ncbi:MAG TPA: hypothetical protein VLV83_06355, partial [Acidobacteriota bacterium]|nr:hypothetical protein [Acidobacteriota bacterium]